MLRGIPLCLLLASLCSGQALDEAIRSLASKLSVHLPAGAVARVSVRNLSSRPDAEAAAIRAVLEKALPHGAGRTAPQVDVALTISQNVRESLLVAELQRQGEPVIEIVSYRPETASKPAQPILEKRLLWEQRNPILDAQIVGDRLLILEPQRLSVYAPKGAVWQLAESKELDAGRPVRDLRGKLEVSNESVTALFPGRVCRGTLAPALDINCEPGDASFAVAGEMAHFTAGRNTLETAGFSASFSLARIVEGAGAIFLAAEPDGRTHLYDGSKRPLSSIDAWGSDVASPETGCAAGRVLLVTSAADPGSAGSITAFTLVDRKPSQAGEPAEFTGSVTALWAEREGATAVIHDPKTGSYAAYFITVDCGS